MYYYNAIFIQLQIVGNENAGNYFFIFIYIFLKTRDWETEVGESQQARTFLVLTASV